MLAYQGRGDKEYLLNRRIVNSATGCWEWIGAKSGSRGYGSMGFNGKTYFVHRIAAFEFLNMYLEDDRVVMHLCDNPICFNPDHLKIGSQSENVSGFRIRHPRQFCEKGHEMTMENSLISSGEGPKCRTCRKNYAREYMRVRRAKQREVINA